MMGEKGAHEMSRISGAIVLAIFLLLPLTTASLYAQRGSHGGAVASVRASAGSSFAARPAPAFSGGVIHRPIVRPRPVIVTQPFGFYPSDGYSPYFYSTPVGASAYPYVDPAYTYADPAYTQSYGVVTQAPAVSPTEADLSYQVGVLSQQIKQVR